jgi:hypothetical protein
MAGKRTGRGLPEAFILGGHQLSFNDLHIFRDCTKNNTNFRWFYVGHSQMPIFRMERETGIFKGELRGCPRKQGPTTKILHLVAGRQMLRWVESFNSRRNFRPAAICIGSCKFYLSDTGDTSQKVLPEQILADADGSDGPHSSDDNAVIQS